MSIKDIIVYVDGGEASKARAGFAVSLTKRFGAEVTGVAFAPKALLPLYGADIGLADMSGVLQGIKTQGEAALALFRTSLSEAGIECEIRLMQGMSEDFPHEFATIARQADLTILGQPRDGDPLVGQYALVERCLFSSGRPVMIVPAAAAESMLDGTIVAAWDGSPQAARAFNDALPFLSAAKRVVILMGISDDDSDDNAPAGDGMVAHLARHGVTADVVHAAVSEGSDMGRLLLSKANDLQADMMVMGAFHHSRWREFILGGVTLTMLEEASMPLFMAH